MRWHSLHAFHRLKNSRIDFVHGADAAQHRVQHAGRAMDRETQLHQPVDDGADLRLRARPPASRPAFRTRLPRFLRQPHPLQAAHLVDDALINAAQSLRRQRSLIM